MNREDIDIRNCMHAVEQKKPEETNSKGLMNIYVLCQIMSQDGQKQIMS